MKISLFAWDMRPQLVFTRNLIVSTSHVTVSQSLCHTVTLCHMHCTEHIYLVITTTSLSPLPVWDDNVASTPLCLILTLASGVLLICFKTTSSKIYSWIIKCKLSTSCPKSNKWQVDLDLVKSGSFFSVYVIYLVSFWTINLIK